MVKIMRSFIVVALLCSLACAQSWQLDGADDYIKTNIIPVTVFGNGGAFTIESMVKFTIAPVSDATGTIFAAYNGSAYFWLIYKSGSIYVARGTGIVTIAATALPTLYGWNHWAWTYDPGTGKDVVYVNGKIAFDSALGGTGAMPTAAIYLGNFNALNYYMGGRFDEARIWKYARTRQQIISSMGRAIVPKQAGLVAYYNFDELTGTAKNLCGDTTYNATRVGTWTHSNAPIMKGVR